MFRNVVVFWFLGFSVFVFWEKKFFGVGFSYFFLCFVVSRVYYLIVLSFVVVVFLFMVVSFLKVVVGFIFDEYYFLFLVNIVFGRWCLINMYWMEGGIRVMKM